MRVLLSPDDARLTTGADVESYDFYRPADPHAAWLRINMVASLDGLATDAAGRSGGLGGDADLRAYRAQRALADVILVGAGTVRAERMGPHVVHASVAERRRGDGRPGPAVLAVVSRSLDLEPDGRLFTAAEATTVVVTCASAPRERRRRLGSVGQVVIAGDDDVDLHVALDRLRDMGLPHILCEGGPRLNADLLRAGLVDELCLTVAPKVLGIPGRRIVAATEGAQARFHLAAVAEEDGELFLRHRTAAGQNSRSSPGSRPRRSS